MCEDGAIVLRNYGKIFDLSVQPVEMMPLNHFYPGSNVLTLGTAGCNLSCQFCSVWEASKARETTILSEQAEPGQIAELAGKLSCKSVGFAYNDPVVYMEYAIDTAEACHEHGLYAVAATSGYINPAPASHFFKMMDAVSIGLKAFNEKTYREKCSASLKPVLDNVQFIRKQTKGWLEINYLVIPGENDSEEEIGKMASWIYDKLGAGTPLHLVGFQASHKMASWPTATEARLKNLRAIAYEKGLKYIYINNRDNEETESTYCSHCTKKIVGRSGFQISEYNLDKSGKCSYCSTLCSGRFTSGPGKSSGRRERVDIQSML